MNLIDLFVEPRTDNLSLGRCLAIIWFVLMGIVFVLTANVAVGAVSVFTALLAYNGMKKMPAVQNAFNKLNGNSLPPTTKKVRPKPEGPAYVARD